MLHDSGGKNENNNFFFFFKLRSRFSHNFFLPKQIFIYYPCPYKTKNIIVPYARLAHQLWPSEGTATTATTDSKKTNIKQALKEMQSCFLNVRGRAIKRGLFFFCHQLVKDSLLRTKAAQYFRASASLRSVVRMSLTGDVRGVRGGRVNLFPRRAANESKRSTHASFS